MNIYFKIEITIEDLSQLIYHVPEEMLMFLRIARGADYYFGIVRDDYYSEILKNASRRSVDSIDLVTKTEIDQFRCHIATDAFERFLGNESLT